MAAMAAIHHLWTIQDTAAWDLAQQRGELRGDGRYADPLFRPAYRWLMQQMVERIPDYDGRRYPVWAWFKPKPDLRSRGHLLPGQPGVRVEFAASEDQFLVSDFDSWHSVLFGGDYIGTSEEDEDAFYKAHKQARADGVGLEALQTKMTDSWQRIFDLDFLAQYPDWLGEATHLQATLGKVSLDQVVKVTEFVGR